MSVEENIRTVKESFEALNQRQLELIGKHMAPGATTQAPGASGPMDSNSYRAYMAGFIQAFPDLHFSIDQIIADGNYVVVNWTATGTHTGPLTAPTGGMIPATGKFAQVSGSTTYDFKDGMSVQAKIFWDMTSLLAQLGLMPVGTTGAS